MERWRSRLKFDRERKGKEKKTNGEEKEEWIRDEKWREGGKKELEERREKEGRKRKRIVKKNEQWISDKK